MSTTEQPAPEIGSAEWARALPPSVHTSGDFEFKRTHVWTDDHGVTQALISFGAVELIFHSPESLRAAIARLAALAGEMDAEIARQRPAKATTHYASSTKGLVSDITPRIACRAAYWAVVSDNLSMVDCEPCKRAVSLPEPEGYPCTRCGATDVPKVDGRCSNHALCDARLAALRADLWRCEGCGWAWPLKDVPSQDAECDACGGTMVKAARDAEAAQVTL